MIKLQSFYWRWFKAIFHYKEHRHTPWKLAAATATALSIVIPPILRFFVRRWFPKYGAAMNDLVWQVPVGIFALLGMVRFFLAPYWLFREKELEAQNHENELESRDLEVNELKKQFQRKSSTSQEPCPALAISDVVSKPASKTTMDVWHIDFSNGVPMLTAIVSNAPARQGKATGRADNVAATISFKNSVGNEIAHVSRAYWFRYSANNVDIESGEQEIILVGGYSNGVFAILDNPRKYSAQRPRYMTTSWRPPKGKMDVFEMPAFIDVDIALVSSDTGETYCTRQARLTKNDKDIKIDML